MSHLDEERALVPAGSAAQVASSLFMDPRESLRLEEERLLYGDTFDGMFSNPGELDVKAGQYEVITGLVSDTAARVREGLRDHYRPTIIGVLDTVRSRFLPILRQALESRKSTAQDQYDKLSGWTRFWNKNIESTGFWKPVLEIQSVVDRIVFVLDDLSNALGESFVNEDGVPDEVSEAIRFVKELCLIRDRAKLLKNEGVWSFGQFEKACESFNVWITSVQEVSCRYFSVIEPSTMGGINSLRISDMDRLWRLMSYNSEIDSFLSGARNSFLGQLDILLTESNRIVNNYRGQRMAEFIVGPAVAAPVEGTNS